MRRILVAGAAAVLIVLAAIALRCRYDATISFLPGASGASWIVYPIPQQTRGRKSLELSCTFRRAFDLAEVPAVGELQVRAFRHASIVLNGTTLTSVRSTSGSWKRPERFDVLALLRPGRNEIAVLVSNDKGPPAVWLRLTAGGFALGSDTSWEASLAGASWEHARDAQQSGGVKVGETLRFSVPSPRRVVLALLAFAVATALLLFGARRVSFLSSVEAGRGVLVVPAVFGIAWVLLFVNDFRSLPVTCGFDAEAHLSYVRYVRVRKSIPLATEGWEMYQPPLYYAVSAAALAAAGAAPGDAAGKAALRAVLLAAGLAHLAFIFASLRLLFPRRPRAALAGSALAACVPVHLYLYQYPTNEGLAAMLVSASVYLGLRVLLEERPSARLLAFLGGALGAALLTKVSALLILPALLVALGADLWLRRKIDARAWLLTLGMPLAVCGVLCGWYYLRVWQRFGSPLVGNWDEGIAVAWWQDPGYRTASYYLHFGRSLTEPFFSGFHGFVDGLYGTFWGDGLWGGAPSITARPPWNYGLMRVGYLLAAVPALIIAIGLFAGGVALWRRPQPRGLFLAGLAATSGLALVHMTLVVPSYAQAKVFYGLAAMIPLCAALGHGFDLIAGRSRLGGALLALGLGVWALSAYASFWIRPDAAATVLRLGVEKVVGHESPEAVPLLQRAVALDPRDADARFWLGYALSEVGRSAESLEQDRKALELDPAQVYAAIDLAMGLDRQGELDRAVAVMRSAVGAAPDDPDALIELGRLLRQKGATAEAIDVLRRAVGRKPDSLEAHDELGRAYGDSGRYDEAVWHLRTALRIDPSSDGTRNALADARSAAGRERR